MRAVAGFLGVLLWIALSSGCSSMRFHGPDDAVSESVRDFAMATCLTEQSNDWLQDQAWSWGNGIVGRYSDGKLSHADVMVPFGHLAMVVRERAGAVPMLYGKTLPAEDPESNPLVLRFCGELMADEYVLEAVKVAEQAIRGLR
ncbi:hypothetical protein [Oceanobacter kriegii]|uniref:hypothetical protein n=1 Tax=Oceanobacter kriegii TaxID=64972 RepID=UPI0012EC77A9|nr:hypothetical protein [Oceanobacter kriegii]